MLPLEGIRVIEIAQNLAGPFCAEILAHLGADVIKVERPRRRRRHARLGAALPRGRRQLVHAVNLAKRSLASTSRIRPRASACCRSSTGADVVVQNLRPGSVEALGLDGPTLTRAQSAACLLLAGALGSVGPLKNRPVSSRWCRPSPA
jgi:crotonobetainyl-CoA:carnitine CoA-transferase CaiB-like acyl-CoA transferase